MSKESKLTPQRREIIRPQVLAREPKGFDRKNVFHFEVVRLVMLLRSAIVEGVPLPEKGPYINFPVFFEAKPHYTVKVEEDNSIRLDVAYVNKRGDKAILHKERVLLNYEAEKIDESEEFIEALKNGEISVIFFVVEPEPAGGREPIKITPDGSISLIGDILEWSKKS